METLDNVERLHAHLDEVSRARRRNPILRTELLGPEDAARLRMGVPENPMVITAVLVLERPLARESLVTLLEARLLLHERFRRRVIEPRFGWRSPRWVDVAAFDLREHCVWHTARAGGPPLEQFVDECMNEPLDRGRPLWRLDVVEGLQGGMALVFRVHHVIADGEALIAILGGLSDEGAASAVPPSQASAASPTAARLLRLLGGVAGAAHLALRASDPATSPYGPIGTNKLVGCSSPLSLAHLIERARAADATVTAMLLAAVAGAMRARLVSSHQVRDLTVHALVPVSLRGAGREDAGNRYASVFVALPLGELAPDERLRRIVENLRAARSRSALRTGAHLVGAAGAASRTIERLAVMNFSRKASVVVSSVRGPASPLHIGRAPVRDVLVWAPAPGNIALAVTLVSYAGRVRVGVLSDARTIGDPTPFVRALERALGEAADRA